MISTHGYVAAVPPLGAADTGGQVVYVLELAKKLAQLGFAVDIWRGVLRASLRSIP
jgi:mannosylfructose-phosphate synthase